MHGYSIRGEKLVLPAVANTQNNDMGFSSAGMFGRDNPDTPVGCKNEERRFVIK
jgi:hypothetical protein